MAGNTNSRGFAVDHEGHCLEDEISDNIAPFAISGDVLAELFSGAGKDTSCSHLEAHPVVGSRGPFPSSSGGIPVADRVTVEEYVSSDEEPLSPHSASELCKNNTSATVHAMMRVSKNERDELLRARRKLGDVLSFLKKHGFSEEQVLKEMVQNEFLKDVPSRDELGLPLSSSAHVVSPGTLNPFVDKMKSKASDLSQSAPVVIGRKVFDEQPKPPIPPAQIPKNAPEIPVEMPHKMQKPETKNEDVPRKSWANVLKKDCPPAPSFNYFPIGDSNIVEPPLDELKKGNDLYKCWACPRVNRIWVKKSENNVKNDEVPKQSNVKPPSPLEGKSHESDANSPAAPSVGALRNDSGLVKVQDQWSEVKRKKGTSSEISEGSPTPPQTFKNLKNVDEIDRKHPTARLTKSQKKKLKLQQGSPSPPPIL
ncbi:hypothetical protein ACET3Z_021324 [Daucus carota]